MPQPEFDIPRINLGVSYVSEHPKATSRPPQGMPEGMDAKERMQALYHPNYLYYPNREGSAISADTQEKLLEVAYNRSYGGEDTLLNDREVRRTAMLYPTTPNEENRLAVIQVDREVDSKAEDIPIGVKLTLHGDKADTVYTFKRDFEEFQVAKETVKHIKAGDVETAAAMNGVYKAAAKRKRAKSNAVPETLDDQAAEDLAKRIAALKPVKVYR